MPSFARRIYYYQDEATFIYNQSIHAASHNLLHGGKQE